MKFKQIISFLFKVLTIFLFVFTLYIMISSVVANKQNKLVNVFGYSYSYVPTSSMDGEYEDSFKANSIVVIKLEKFNNIKLHDVIVYQATIELGSGNTIDILEIHRVINVNEDGSLTTKGDHPSAHEEKIVTSSNYQGKLVKAYQMPAIFSSMGSIQIIVIFIIIVFLILFVIYQFLHILKTIKEDKLKKIKEEEYEKLKEEVLKEIKGE